jgi:TonB family protein
MVLVMNTAVTRNDWVGRVLDGRFPLLEWLGNTEQAGVFRTELKGPEPRRAVIRLLPADPADAEARLLDWKRAAALSHPHLMRIFESGRAQVGGVELLYVVTEYAEESLAQVIPERPLSTGEAREMLGPILDALAYLHGQGMVHGHIKPSNVMVIDEGVKLPMESARRAGAITAQRGQLKIYDAPEVASGTMVPGSDIWSLGVTLVEALAQHPPAWDRSIRQDPSVPAEIGAPFVDIARGCLRFDPGKRVSVRDIGALLNPSPSLREPAGKIDQVAPTKIGADASGPKASSTTRMAAIVAGIVVLVAVIVFALTRSHPSQPAPSATQAPAPAVTPAPQPPSPPPPEASPRGTARVKGEVAERVMPNVTESANRTIHGKVDVTVRVKVDASGAVADARLESRGPSQYFATKALDAARKWRFKPAQKDGNAVPSAWTLRFQFRRSGPEVIAAEVSP